MRCSLMSFPRFSHYVPPRGENQADAFVYRNFYTGDIDGTFDSCEQIGCESKDSIVGKISWYIHYIGIVVVSRVWQLRDFLHLALGRMLHYNI